MEKLKEKKVPIYIALLQWFITTVFQVDRLFFTYDYESKYFLVTKLLYLLLLLIVWCFIFEAVKGIKSGSKNWRRGFFIFKIYFSVMMCFLLILWPGMWVWDDVWTLERISRYDQWDVWQHIITGVYQDVLLQILPFPGGVILLQNVIVSLCVAFAVTKLEVIFGIGIIKNGVVDTIIKLLPFLLPPVLSYQFSGYRIGLYVYLELVMLVMMIGAQNDEEGWHTGYLVLFSVLCIIVATWRTEAFFYVPCVFLIVIFTDKRVLLNRKKLLCILMVIIGIQAVNTFQKNELGNANYEVVSLIRQCTELVKAADYAEDAEVLKDIDRVASLEIIRNNPTRNGEWLYFNAGVVRNDYTEEDYSAFLKAIIKLSVKYPKVVAAERWNVFVDGSGINGSCITNIGSAILFEPENESTAAKLMQNVNWIANRPVFKTARKILIYALGMRVRKSDGSYFSGVQRLVWNSIIPELVLLYAWLKLLILKKWRLLGICTAVLIRIPVVVLTQPAHWFMYTLSFYFLGYICLIYGALVFWSNHKRGMDTVV